MKSLIIISNPVARKASDRKVAMASYYLQSKGYKVDVFFTQKKGDAERLARDAAQKSPGMVVAAGGDGTFNEVINGIAETDMPVGLLPLGTTNVLAREIGIPEDVRGAMEIVARKTPRPVSLGKIILSNGKPRARYFGLMAGIGYDGETVRGIREGLKKVSGKGAYVMSGFSTLAGLHLAELTFASEGETYTGYSAIVGNAARYGGPFKVTPDATMTAPLLYACIFKGKGRLDIIRYVSGILTGRHLKMKDIAYIHTTRLEIRGKAHIQVDGDYLGMTPATIEVVPDALRLVF